MSEATHYDLEVGSEYKPFGHGFILPPGIIKETPMEDGITKEKEKKFYFVVEYAENNYSIVGIFSNITEAIDLAEECAKNNRGNIYYFAPAHRKIQASGVQHIILEP